MTIGIQGQGIAPQSSGLASIGNIDTTSQALAPVNAVSQQNSPNNWLQYDLPNRDPSITSWGQFSIDPNIDYANLLKTAYTNPSLGKGTKQYLTQESGLAGMGGPKWQTANYENQWGQSNGAFNILGKGSAPQTRTTYAGTPESQAYYAAIDAMHKNPGISFKDSNTQNAMLDLNKSLQGGGVTSKSPPGFGGLLDQTSTTPITYGNNYDTWNPVSDAQLNKTASQYGLTYDSLKASRGMYERAYKDLYDPVGSNWQDLKNSPIYDKALAGIRQYSGQPDSFYAALNNKASASSNPFSLPAEYFALHDPNQIRAGANGANGFNGFNMGAIGFNGFNGFEGNMGVIGPIGGKGYSDISGSNPYQRQDWQDYTTGTTPWWSQTADQQTQAKADMAHHNTLLSATPENGGAFDLGKASGYAPSSTKRGGGYKWKDSPSMNQFDIAQNMGAWNGVKDPTTIDPNDALKSGLQYIAPKKKGKGFTGILGSIAKIASFVPGPWQIPAQFVSAGVGAYNGFSNGNPLGGLLSLAGAPISGGSLLSRLGSKIGSATGLGSRAGNAITSAGAGAISGASSGNALVGGLSGGLGSIGSSMSNPYLSTAIGTVAPNTIQYLNQQQKNRQALQAYKARMGIT